MGALRQVGGDCELWISHGELLIDIELTAFSIQRKI
jgi:hypothetical protein